MKDVLMMVLGNCPHCRHAREIMEKLCEEHPAYRAVHFRIVDEAEHPDFAATLDYHYVPTIFVDGQKMHEGVPTRQALEAIYLMALEK